MERVDPRDIVWNQSIIEEAASSSLPILGCGGSGDVGRYHHPSGIEMALKKIDLTKVSDVIKAQRELTISQGLSGASRHIVKCYHTHIHEERQEMYIFMELCPGGTLRDYLRPNAGKRRLVRKLPPGKAIEVFRQLIEGYLALVDKEIIHRDLKPANILRTEKTWKIADFGLARELQKGETAFEYGGTYAYMSPEKLSIGGHTASTDIWSLGVILFEMLFGHVPFKGRSRTTVLASIKKEREGITVLATYPGIAELIRRMIVFDANQRIKALEVKAEIERIVSLGLELIPFTITEEDDKEEFIRAPELVLEAQPISPYSNGLELPSLLEYEKEKLLFVLETTSKELPAYLELSNINLIAKTLQNFAKYRLLKVIDIFERTTTYPIKRLEKDWIAFSGKDEHGEYLRELKEKLIKLFPNQEEDLTAGYDSKFVECMERITKRVLEISRESMEEGTILEDRFTLMSLAILSRPLRKSFKTVQDIRGLESSVSKMTPKVFYQELCNKLGI